MARIFFFSSSQQKKKKKKKVKKSYKKSLKMLSEVPTAIDFGQKAIASFSILDFVSERNPIKSYSSIKNTIVILQCTIEI